MSTATDKSKELTAEEKLEKLMQEAQAKAEQLYKESQDRASALLADAEKKAAEKIEELVKESAATMKQEAQETSRKIPKTIQELVDRGEELVPVKLFKDSGKYKDDVFVAVNGEGCLIQRGVEVKVKRKFADVLEQSMNQDEQTASLIGELTNEFKKKRDMLTE